jgi:hypothetical protein
MWSRVRIPPGSPMKSMRCGVSKCAASDFWDNPGTIKCKPWQHCVTLDATRSLAGCSLPAIRHGPALGTARPLTWPTARPFAPTESPLQGYPRAPTTRAATLRPNSARTSSRVRAPDVLGASGCLVPREVGESAPTPLNILAKKSAPERIAARVRPLGSGRRSTKRCGRLKP